MSVHKCPVFSKRSYLDDLLWSSSVYLKTGVLKYICVYLLEKTIMHQATEKWMKYMTSQRESTG
jgi:hypothetical protein